MTNIKRKAMKYSGYNFSYDLLNNMKLFNTKSGRIFNICFEKMRTIM